MVKLFCALQGAGTGAGAAGRDGRRGAPGAATGAAGTGRAATTAQTRRGGGAAARDGEAGALRTDEESRRVRAGRLDWTAVSGVERWLGGVRLRGPGTGRWDDASRSVRRQ